MAGNVKASSVQSGADGSIDVEFVDNIAVLRMNRGENRINDDFIEKMQQALDKVESNSSTKALITTGNGRFYCNGLDLGWLKYVGDERSEVTRKNLQTLWIRLVTFPMPTMAAINGHAFAGGAILSLVHDYRLMRTKMGFWCLNEVHLGLFFSPNMLAIIRNKMTPVAIREAVVYGKRLPAEVACEYDVIHRTCEGSQLMSDALAMAKQLTEKNDYNRNNLKNMKTDIWKEVLEAKALTAADTAKL